MAKAKSQKSLDSWTKEEWGPSLARTLLKVKMLLVNVTCQRKQESSI